MNPLEEHLERLEAKDNIPFDAVMRIAERYGFNISKEQAHAVCIKINKTALALDEKYAILHDAFQAKLADSIAKLV